MNKLFFSLFTGIIRGRTRFIPSDFFFLFLFYCGGGCYCSQVLFFVDGLYLFRVTCPCHLFFLKKKVYSFIVVVFVTVHRYYSWTDSVYSEWLALPIFSSLKKKKKKKSLFIYCGSGCYCSQVLFVDGLCLFRVTCPSHLFFFKKKEEKKVYLFIVAVVVTVHRYYSWTDSQCLFRVTCPSHLFFFKKVYSFIVVVFVTVHRWILYVRSDFVCSEWLCPSSL